MTNEADETFEDGVVTSTYSITSLVPATHEGTWKCSLSNNPAVTTEVSTSNVVLSVLSKCLMEYHTTVSLSRLTSSSALRTDEQVNPIYDNTVSMATWFPISMTTRSPWQHSSITTNFQVSLNSHLVKCASVTQQNSSWPVSLSTPLASPLQWPGTRHWQELHPLRYNKTNFRKKTEIPHW